MNAVLKELAYLGTHKKLQLVEDLWDSNEQESMPIMTDELHAELLRRTARGDANRGHDVTLEQIAEKLCVRL